MGIIQDIESRHIGLDTSVFIYFIEEEEKYINIVTPIFEAIDAGHLSAVTSGITLLEMLVIPLRNNDFKLADKYEQIVTESKGLKCFNLDRDLLRQAAQIRAAFGIKTPDALQIAAALVENCRTFITNDRRLPKIAGLQILQLSDYI